MGKTVEISDTNFDNEVKRSTIPVLVDFWAPWCAPCRMQIPVIEELSQELEGKAMFGKINVDENPAKAVEYTVSGIPTLILFVGGKIVERFIGFQPKNQLKNIIQKYIK